MCFRYLPHGTTVNQTWNCAEEIVQCAAPIIRQARNSFRFRFAASIANSKCGSLPALPFFEATGKFVRFSLQQASRRALRPVRTISTAHFTIFVSSSFVSFSLHRSSKSFTQKERDAPVIQHERAPDHKSPSKKGDLWLTPILSAHQKTLAVRKKTTLTSTTFFTNSMKLSSASSAAWRYWSRSVFSTL